MKHTHQALISNDESHFVLRSLCGTIGVYSTEERTLIKKIRSVKIIDFIIGCIDWWTPFDASSTFYYLENSDKEFYLVERDEKQFLVTVTDEFIETKKILVSITTEKFEIGNWKFTNCGEVRVKKETRQN